jgi:hypothetical protein
VASHTGFTEQVKMASAVCFKQGCTSSMQGAAIDTDQKFSPGLTLF